MPGSTSQGAAKINAQHYFANTGGGGMTGKTKKRKKRTNPFCRGCKVRCGVAKLKRGHCNSCRIQRAKDKARADRRKAEGAAAELAALRRKQQRQYDRIMKDGAA